MSVFLRKNGSRSTSDHMQEQGAEGSGSSRQEQEEFGLSCSRLLPQLLLLYS